MKFVSIKGTELSELEIASKKEIIKNNLMDVIN